MTIPHESAFRRGRLTVDVKCWAYSTSGAALGTGEAPAGFETYLEREEESTVPQPGLAYWFVLPSGNFGLVWGDEFEYLDEEGRAR